MIRIAFRFSLSVRVMVSISYLQLTGFLSLWQLLFIRVCIFVWHPNLDPDRNPVLQWVSQYMQQ